MEAAALTWLQQLYPAHAPQLLLYDQQHSVLAMSWVPAPHIKLVEVIQNGQVTAGCVGSPRCPASGQACTGVAAGWMH